MYVPFDPRTVFTLLLVSLGVAIIAGCGPAAGPIAGVPATPRGPATALDGAATPTTIPSPSPTPVPVPTDTPTPLPVPTDTPTPTPVAATVTPVPSPQPATATPTAPSAGNIDLAVQKTAQCNQSTGACTFTITVVNNGPGSYYGGIPIQDSISPTVPFTITSFGGAGGTICYLSGSTLNCGPHYPVTLSPGGAYTLTIMAQIGSPGTFQNCATLQLQDNNPANNQACVRFSVTAASGSTAPDLSVQKTGQCNWPYTCNFTITVTNVGSAPYSGSLTVADQTSPTWSTLLAGGGSTSGASCSFSGSAVVCQAPGLNLAPGQSQTFTFGVYFGPSGYFQAFQNCASIPTSTDANQSNNQACIALQPPVATPTPR